MKVHITALLVRFPWVKKVVGVVLVVIGALALITPLTPGSWLALIGLELLGIRILLPQRFRRTRTHGENIGQEGTTPS